MKRLLISVMVVVVMLTGLAPVASAQEYVQNPVSGEYWYCDYYSDGYYWCWIDSAGMWTHAKPGFQYSSALGG